ncbi:MAG: FGGY-family carbohydrate kinase [Rudaea sp.]
MLLALDVGTTHCKAGLFREDGELIRAATRPMVARRAASGYSYFDPGELLGLVSQVAREAVGEERKVDCIGIASMAESGLLVDRRSGEPRSPILPWFDTSAGKQAESLLNRFGPLDLFSRIGIHLSYKASLAKILWLQKNQRVIADGATWLSAADYIAYRLTGEMGTDYSLSTRTGAFRIDSRTWDTDLLRTLTLEPDLFPSARIGGAVLGPVNIHSAHILGVAAGTPVAVAGHDHVCASLGVGAIQPGLVFDSMGTAEALCGVRPRVPLGEREFRSGLVFGCHLLPGTDYWMGGLSSSGGSVEWLRRILGEPALDYGQVTALLETASEGPGDILYFPYLLGNKSRAPRSNAQGALIGLRDTHSRADLALAVLEGTAYEMETIRLSAQALDTAPITHLIAAGGGTRLGRWLQIKADVSGCEITVPNASEATLLGAALAAGAGAGIYPDAREAVKKSARPASAVFRPDPDRHAAYCRIFENEYSTWQNLINREKSGAANDASS